jgi:putative transposase
MADWPHSPLHRLDARGTFMVTSGTYRKIAIFNSRRRLNFLRDALFASAANHGIALQAWAIFPNHYHFVATAERFGDLREMIRSLHSITAKKANTADGGPGRKVWFQYWESRISYERSYFARLRYVHENAVRHGIVRLASRYEWCSASWFEQRATAAFRRTVFTFPSNSLAVRDDFEVEVQPYLSE